MKKLYNWLRENFEMGMHEAYTVIYGFGFVLILFAAFGLYTFTSAVNNKEIIVKTYGAPEEKLESLQKKQNKYTYYPNKSYEKNKREFRPFDPNTADLNTLKANHFPDFLAERLLKYRDKGGKFRIKEDLLNLYGIRESFYEELKPYLQLPDEIAEYAKEETASPIKTILEETPKKSYKKPDIEPFDINLASVEQLEQVKGIGKVFASRIIKYRESLGGFHDIDQIKNTYGLPDSTFLVLKNFIFVEAPVKKLKINELNLNDWKGGFPKFHQKKAIIAYREQHGYFKNEKDFDPVRVLNQEEKAQLIPYLDFSVPNE